MTRMWNGAPILRGNSLYVWPAQALALLPGRSKAVLTRFLRAHLQTTYPRQSATTKPGQTKHPHRPHTRNQTQPQENPPSPRPQPASPTTQNTTRKPLPTLQTQAKTTRPSLPNATTPRQKGAPSGETTPNPKSGAAAGDGCPPPSRLKRTPEDRRGEGIKTTVLRWPRRGIGGISISRAA